MRKNTYVNAETYNAYWTIFFIDQYLNKIFDTYWFCIILLEMSFLTKT